ncbi:MAG: hypothetical protein J0L77_08785 [Alphaproteobacteria bacterium]|nr:hypothetical protein [Alphaproteobacteria bacterium]
MIKKILSRLYYDHVHHSAFGYRFRHWRGHEPFIELKPYRSQAVVSDIFVWRCDDIWDTEFELFNVTSFMFPADSIKETCDLVFFDSAGHIFKKEKIILEPFERKTLNIRDYVSPRTSIGGFSVFHHSGHEHRFSAQKSHLTERGYIGYRRKGDQIKSFCHGNLQSLAHEKGRHDYAYVTASKPHSKYYPQLIISDSSHIELVYTNPTHKHQKINLTFFDRSGKPCHTAEATLPPRGVHVISVPNPDMILHTFENRGGIALWRPVIFKHYASHFDAMHG